MSDILEIFLLGLFAISIILFIYWFVISFFGFGRPKQLPKHKPQKRFIFLVPAHNEETVIGQLVNSLAAVDYPKQLFDIVVIADNCTDKTATIARREGAKVIEHTSLPGEQKGKPFAIRYAVEVLGEQLSQEYDGIVVMDADNLASKNFLTEMNNHLCEGHRLIQCYLDTKNPNDNWISLGYAASYYYMNRAWQLGKSRLSLGNAVGGTGFVVDTNLFNQIGWTARSLTEDLEFTMQCLLENEQAYWSHEARIYDEKPTGFKASCVQRLRWARGHWDTCFSYAGPLLFKGFKNLDIKAFDGFLYLINPAKIIMTSFLDLLCFSQLIMNLTGYKGFLNMTTLVPLPVFLVLLLVQFIYFAYCVKVDGAKDIPIVKAYVSMFILNLTYIPLFIWALLTYKVKDWNPTQHNRVINNDDLNQQEVAS